MFLRRRGSITVFISIVLAVLIPLCCILTDLARYSMAKKQAEAALKTCTESMLAAYDRQLKEQYGLFAMYPRTIEAMEEELFDLLARNLNEGAAADGVSDLYGFDVLSVKVMPIYNLSEPYVLKQQAAEFMKYRAPIQVIQEFYEKLKLMTALKKEAELIDLKMNLDRLMNDIRSELIILHYMINDKLTDFNRPPQGQSGSMKETLLKQVISNTTESSERVNAANEEAEPIKTAQDAYAQVYPRYRAAQQNVNSAREMVDDADARLSRVESDLEQAYSALSKNPTDSAIQAKVNNLKSDLSNAKEAYSRALNVLHSAQIELNDRESEVLDKKREIDERASKALGALDTAILLTGDSVARLHLLLDHLKKHERFHRDLIEVVDHLVPSIEELDKQSTKLQESAQSHESDVSGIISGDIDRQIQSIKKVTFTQLRSRLKANLEALAPWIRAVENSIATLGKTGSELVEVRIALEAVKSIPEDLNKRYNGYGAFQMAKDAVASLESALSGLKELGKMQEVYKIPTYQLEPQPNAREKDAFNQWFNEKYLGYDKIEEPVSKDETELRSIRSGIKSLAVLMAEKGGDKSNVADDAGVDLQQSPERRLILPSVTGALSSDEKLESIGDIDAESSNNGISFDNPLDRPNEGLDQVNEKTSNFFGFELSRILDLLEQVKIFAAESMESFTEDLYFNEYIVSAFENAASEDKIEHDIGWMRPLKSSYFKSAEAEYIIFGKSAEKANIRAARTSIFGIRLLFNLLHIYTDPEKLAASLQLAASIAGWTVFGVPLVQNFLLIGWAGAESYVDVEVLSQGEKVPLIKTSASWFLDLDNLADYLKNIVLLNIKTLAQERMNQEIDKLSNTVRDTVMSFINSKVDLAFGRLEGALNDLVTDASSEITHAVNTVAGRILTQTIKFNSLESLSASIEEAISRIMATLTQSLAEKTAQEIAQYKIAIKQSIERFIFDSPLYVRLVEGLRNTGNKLIEKGITAIEGQIDGAFGNVGKSRSNNIAARLVMMDYTDYLRLLLLAVPAEKKALRAADLMQLNIQQVSNNNTLSMGQYNTYVFIQAEVDFNTWFLPESLFKKKDAGMISIAWSQGY